MATATKVYEEPGQVILVKGPPRCTKEDLQRFLEQHGPQSGVIESIHMRDGGEATVVYSNPTAANAACASLSGAWFRRHRLRLTKYSDLAAEDLRRLGLHWLPKRPQSVATFRTLVSADGAFAASEKAAKASARPEEALASGEEGAVIDPALPEQLWFLKKWQDESSSSASMHPALKLPGKTESKIKTIIEQREVALHLLARKQHADKGPSHLYLRQCCVAQPEAEKLLAEVLRLQMELQRELFAPRATVQKHELAEGVLEQEKVVQDLHAWLLDPKAKVHQAQEAAMRDELNAKALKALEHRLLEAQAKLDEVQREAEIYRQGAEARVQEALAAKKKNQEQCERAEAALAAKDLQLQSMKQAEASTVQVLLEIRGRVRSLQAENQRLEAVAASEKDRAVSLVLRNLAPELHPDKNLANAEVAEAAFKMASSALERVRARLL